MKIRKLDLVRLYAVNEVANEDGHYDLVPFDGEVSDFNKEFEQEDLDDELDSLLDHLYGGGSYIEVDENTDLEICGECIRISVGGDYIEVPCNPDKINNDPDNSTIYLLVDQRLEDGCWIVSERVAS